jgi:hypothetical protein
MCGSLAICGKVSIPSVQGKWSMCYSLMLHAQRYAFAYNKDNSNSSRLSLSSGILSTRPNHLFVQDGHFIIRQSFRDITERMSALMSLVPQFVYHCNTELFIMYLRSLYFAFIRTLRTHIHHWFIASRMFSLHWEGVLQVGLLIFQQQSKYMPR